MNCGTYQGWRLVRVRHWSHAAGCEVCGAYEADAFDVHNYLPDDLYTEVYVCRACGATTSNEGTEMPF